MLPLGAWGQAGAGRVARTVKSFRGTKALQAERAVQRLRSHKLRDGGVRPVLRQRAVGGKVVRFPQVLPKLNPAVPENLAEKMMQQELLAAPVEKSLQPRLGEEPTPLIYGTFQARPSGSEKTNFFSGTIFQLEYEGKTEVYGVVSAHAVAQNKQELKLGRHFTADVYVKGKFVSVPVEIVQAGSSSMVDVALVKFPAWVEPLLKPLKISSQEVAFNQVLQTQGFVDQQAVFIPQRHVRRITPLAIQTSMPLAREHRAGLCGSPVVTEDGQLAGVHMGSSYGRFSQEDDIGYIVPVRGLKQLVLAYHHDVRAIVPFEVNGTALFNMEVDEYITEVVLFKRDGSEAYRYEVNRKFSYRRLNELLEIFRPQEIEITVQRSDWSGEFLVEKRGDWTSPGKKYRYNFDTQRTLLFSPSPTPAHDFLLDL